MYGEKYPCVHTYMEDYVRSYQINMSIHTNVSILFIKFLSMCHHITDPCMITYRHIHTIGYRFTYHWVCVCVCVCVCVYDHRDIWNWVQIWRREWQTTSVFWPWELHEQCGKAKRWTPQVSRCQHATGEEWRKSSGKNEEVEAKWNNTQLWMWLVMEVNRSECVAVEYILVYS